MRHIPWCHGFSQDLSSTFADIGVTLSGLSQIVTADLARDIFPDLIGLLNHSRPIIRKRGVIALYKAMVSYPETLETAITRLGEKLDDPDPSSPLLIYSKFHVRIDLVAQLSLLQPSMYCANLRNGVRKTALFLPLLYSICLPHLQIIGCSSRS
jgi:hypothetical protein